MSHSNIVSYIESFRSDHKLHIIMEFADGGDLTQAIARRTRSSSHWSEDEAMRIFVQIGLALQHIHAKNILHRDLKPGNVFLTSRGVVKLGDFGKHPLPHVFCSSFFWGVLPSPHVIDEGHARRLLSRSLRARSTLISSGHGVQLDVDRLTSFPSCCRP